jgi:hypothetical protein
MGRVELRNQDGSRSDVNRSKGRSKNTSKSTSTVVAFGGQGIVARRRITLRAEDLNACLLMMGANTTSLHQHTAITYESWAYRVKPLEAHIWYSMGS